jgi:hypothetical protein
VENLARYEGRARVVITGAVLTAHAELTSWREGDVLAWGGSLRMGCESMARITAWDGSARVELDGGEDTSPFTAEAEGDGYLWITGQGPAPFGRDAA